MRNVSVLYVRHDSAYKQLPGADVYDINRDARTCPDGLPVVAHPPCRAWGRLRTFAKPRHDERELAIHAVEMVRRNGGVLEHPERSTLWAHQGLPLSGTDEWGGYTISVDQFWWGHRARKATWLYVCGVRHNQLPPIPLCFDAVTHVVQTRRTKYSRPHISKAEREHTPPRFASWLLELARISQPPTPHP